MAVPRHQIRPRSQRSRTAALLVHSEGEDEEEEEENNLAVRQQILEQGEEEDDEEDGDDDEDSTEYEEEEDNGENVEYIEILDSPSRVFDGDGRKGAIKKGKDCSPSPNDSQENRWDANVTDDLFCPICMEAWASSGDHHVWCVSTLLFWSFLFFYKYCGENSIML